jgi:ATP adenylyltransferase
MTLDHLWAGWRSAYIESVTGAPDPGDCLFCVLATADPTEAMVLARDDLVFALMNAYPYTSGHLMVAPIRHEGALTGLTDAEAAALMTMTRAASVALERAYRPDGLNVGMNLGRAAGAGIPAHLHLHTVPRWSGDTNFMTTVADARVLPESLQSSWEKLRAAWPTRT